MSKIIGFWGGKMLPVHTGHIHSILTAASYCDELHVVLFYNEVEEKKWVSRSKFPQHLLTPKFREMVLRAELKDYPYIKIHAINSAACSLAAKLGGITETTWKSESREVLAKIGRQPDLVFSSEPAYDEDFKACYPNAKHILIDVDRDLFPISGTEMRRDGAFKHWDFVPKTYKKYCAKSVLIVGTESCGKSTLVQKLAQVFNTSYVHEVGRDICEEYGTGQPPLDSYYDILYATKVAEKRAREVANKVYFVDTEAAITQYYAKLYENNDLIVADEIIKNEKYDLVIYLEPDVKWVDDGMRIHGDKETRESNNIMLKNLLDKYGIQYVTIGGDYSERYLKSIKLVKEIM